MFLSFKIILHSFFLLLIFVIIYLKHVIIVMNGFISNALGLKEAKNKQLITNLLVVVAKI